MVVMKQILPAKWLPHMCGQTSTRTPGPHSAASDVWSKLDCYLQSQSNQNPVMVKRKQAYPTKISGAQYHPNPGPKQ